MKYFLLLSVLTSLLTSAELSPRSVIEAAGNVQQIALYEGKIIAGTSVGTLEMYKLSDATKLSSTQFPKIKDFTGDEVAPKIFSVDMLDNTLLAVVQASSGARELYLVEEGKSKILIDAHANLFISKAKFVDKNRILVALLSNELLLWDIKNKKEIYRIQPSSSHFSDFTLNETKSMVASSCESGEITIFDAQSGKIIKVLKGGNVDNVYKVDFKKEKVLCAGQDRRGIVYDLSNGAYERFDGSFLIYAGALSPSLKWGAFAFNEQNDIVLFDLATKSKVHTLKGQKSTLNTIVFASERELVSASDDQFIMIWRLP
ncbi:WD40 repeat domain-containing protein [Sulfurospirillum sp.]|uniref:WD40 repeat domain-containing protein n=1 Tax=Sulfurospirillum sp. TaxID=2053622 RepID=UPI002FDCAE2D